MTLETARQALRFGAQTTGGSCGIVLFGGEPLFREGGDLFLNKHYNPVYPLVSLMEDGVRRGNGNGGD